MSICNSKGGVSAQYVTVVCFVTSILWGSVSLAAGDKTELLDNATLAGYRAAITDMKDQPRGPFKRLRWFCNDGTILPPKSFACQPHGGGRQHGQWSDATVELRENGFYIGNVLAATDPLAVVNNYSPEGELQALMLEQFLVDVDDGWILRKARSYRGAFQIENEQEVGSQILKALTSDNAPFETRYLLILEAFKRLPFTAGDQSLVNTVRTTASSLNDEDKAFGDLRNSIHGKLSIDDAARVRAYAEQNRQSPRHADMIQLADNIDLIFSPGTVEATLRDLVDFAPTVFQAILDLWRSSTNQPEKYSALADAMFLLREYLQVNSSQRFEGFQLVARLEQAAFSSGSLLRQYYQQSSSNNDSLVSRRKIISSLLAGHKMLYGVGLLTNAEYAQANKWVRDANGQSDKNDNTTASFSLTDYQSLLRNLERIPVWSERRVQFFFGEQVRRFSSIEPLAINYVPDRLRGSPLLSYTEMLKSLTADAAVLSGVQHSFFDKPVSYGFRVLNPGVAKGELHTPETLEALVLKPDEVVLVVPETLADLPAVTGILTAFEGNQLSHVQLLARNLGVPNVVVTQELINELPKYYGKKIEILASKNGVVSINLLSSDGQTSNTEAAQAIKSNAIDFLIKVDEAKLDLTQTESISTKDLDATASGVTVGPKAAKVAQLSKQFAGTVPPGVAIPFGSFRKLLDDNLHPNGDTMFDWIKSQYSQMSLLDGAELADFQTAFLDELTAWFSTVELDSQFVSDLREKMRTEFGEEGTYGVFVRSDTNVEDLPGFTGAGLNLTDPHVVGFDAVLESIRNVWASPFSERAFGWRQARMDKPEHVYTAILLHKSVASDKSGVLVTTDIFDGQDNKLSVVLNEGVAGGVDGLSAESVRIDRSSAATDLLASATADRKRILLDQGGSSMVPASGVSRQLNEQNIRDLIAFSDQVGGWFSNDQNAIADVEFGFKEEQFVLFQIRPLVESAIGSSDPRLVEMDRALNQFASTRVILDEAPQ